MPFLDHTGNQKDTMQQSFTNMSNTKKMVIVGLALIMFIGLMRYFYPGLFKGPGSDPVDDPVKDPTDDPADDPVDDPVDEPVDEPVADPDALPGEEGYVYPACQYHAMGKSKGVWRDKCNADLSCGWEGNVDTGRCHTRILGEPVVCSSFGKPRYCYRRSDRCAWDESINRCMGRQL